VYSSGATGVGRTEGQLPLCSANIPARVLLYAFAARGEAFSSIASS